MCKKGLCAEKKQGSWNTPRPLFRFDSSKVEYFCEGVTGSGIQPFPRQNRGQETMTQIYATRSDNNPDGKEVY